MSRISSGINGLDDLIDSLYIGDNVVWEIDAGTSFDIFVQRFITQSFREGQKVLYVSFNRSPQSILNEMTNYLEAGLFILIDCFTSGKGKNDLMFARFYEHPGNTQVVRIERPKSIEDFTQKLTTIEDSLPPGARYIFDSLTGMQDLWGDENNTYQFFTYMCPRLYDLGTVAYWILEKDAHSQKFKANLRHITQIVLDLYKRKDSLYMKALKLTGRQQRDAFKPHLYEIHGSDVTITFPRKELHSDIGSRLREVRVKNGMSQKELAGRVNLTPSFISQLENNQISPSLSSFLQICAALGVNPAHFIVNSMPEPLAFFFKRERVLSSPAPLDEGTKVCPIVNGEKISARIIILSPEMSLPRHLLSDRAPEFVYLMHGDISVSLKGRKERLHAGDSVYLKNTFPSQWKNEGGDDAELLVIS